MKILFTLSIFLLLFGVSATFAQEAIINGVVVGSEDGQPLPGVTIVVKGTSIGTQSNTDGKFSIKLPESNKQLEFRYIGFITQTVSVGNSKTLHVKLKPDATQLNELMVVGYGTQKKSDFTGSTSSIKGDDIRNLTTQRVDQALQGQATGVMVMNTDAAPGGNTVIRVRGMNSINGGNNALVVIDGLQGGNLNSLNPSDIESVEVLKDASATAIYGSQGANGVILVTTKIGKKGKPAVSYSYSGGVQKISNKLDLMNAGDYARTINANTLTQDGKGVTPIPIFSSTDIQKYDTNGGTDWQDVIYRPASIQNHEVSIGGGTDNLKYMLSGGFLNQEGILKNSGYKRFSIRANVTTDITKWAAFGLNWAGTKESGNTPAFGSDVIHLGNAVNVAARWAPTEPIYDAEGNYSIHRSGYGASDTWNPLASAIEPFLDNNINRNTLNTYFELKPLNGLKLRITGGAIIRNLNNKNFYNNKTYEGRQSKGLGNDVEELSSHYQNSNILTYDKTLGSHHFTFTAVAEQQFEKFSHSAARASDFMVEQTGVFDLAGANIVTNESNATKRVINSYLGRVNYVFKDRYLLTASYRADGSSVFGKNNKWGYFPSASIAWRASEEDFIKKMDIFSDLKFRGSWGITGNQAINPYQTLSRISSGSNYPYNGGEGTDLGFYISAAQNPKLKWESTTQTDLGIDLGIFKGRLTATADYYKKTTRDLLMPRGVPGYTGYESVIDNVGSIENKGFEFAISGEPSVGRFKWNTGITFSANRNKVLDLGEIDRIGYRTTTGGYSVNNPFMFLVKGEPFGQIYGFGYEGTWKQAEASSAAKYGQLPGDGKYNDVNNDGKIDGSDLMVIGNAFPKFIFGWNNRMSYKNFDLTVLVQGSKGNDIFNQARIRLEAPGAGTSARLLDRWTVDNQNTDVPAFTPESVREQANLTGTVLISGDQRLSRWVEDGSYIRLKNVTLGYNFPKSMISKISLSNLRAYVTATNLVTLTKYTGYDPEVSSFNANDAMMGVDLGNYPQARMFSLGLNLAF